MRSRSSLRSVQLRACVPDNCFHILVICRTTTVGEHFIFVKEVFYRTADLTTVVGYSSGIR